MSSQQPQSKHEMPIAEVVGLAGLVSYQEGAVLAGRSSTALQGRSRYSRSMWVGLK